MKLDRKVWRTQLLVYPKFQIALLLFNLGIMGLSSLAVGLLVHRSYSFLREEGMAANLSPNHAYFKFLEYQSSTVYAYLGGAFIVSFLISVFCTLILSNKLAGPVVRLKSYFKQVASGQKPIPAVFFRKGDFFRELPPIINEAIDKLQKDDSKDSSEKKSDTEIKRVA